MGDDRLVLDVPEAGAKLGLDAMRATRRRNAATFQLSKLVDCCGCRSRLLKKSSGSPSDGRNPKSFPSRKHAADVARR
jgi:hypothetical protein